MAKLQEHQYYMKMLLNQLLVKNYGKIVKSKVGRIQETIQEEMIISSFKR